MAKSTQEPIPAKPVCFFVTPLGDDNSPERVRANNVMDFILSPALQECGYATPPERADQMPHPGRITHQIIDKLINADLVVADLSDHNPNVFYELAIRHAVRKPIVQIIHTNYTIPFDVANQRTIFYDHQDLRLADEARKKIVRQIKAAKADPGNVDTPLTEALQLTALSQSADPVAKTLVEMMTTMQHIQAEVTDLRRAGDIGRISAPLAKLSATIPPTYTLAEALEMTRPKPQAVNPAFQGYLDSLTDHMKTKEAEGEEPQGDE